MGMFIKLRVCFPLCNDGEPLSQDTEEPWNRGASFSIFIPAAIKEEPPFPNSGLPIRVKQGGVIFQCQLLLPCIPVDNGETGADTSDTQINGLIA